MSVVAQCYRRLTVKVVSTISTCENEILNTLIFSLWQVREAKFKKHKKHHVSHNVVKNKLACTFFYLNFVLIKFLLVFFLLNLSIVTCLAFRIRSLQTLIKPKFIYTNTVYDILYLFCVSPIIFFLTILRVIKLPILNKKNDFL